jgi:hypothetical protein
VFEYSNRGGKQAVTGVTVVTRQPRHKCIDYFLGNMCRNKGEVNDANRAI